MKGFENNAEYYQFDHVTRISSRELANITCVMIPLLDNITFPNSLEY